MNAKVTALAAVGILAGVALLAAARPLLGAVLLAGGAYALVLPRFVRPRGAAIR